MSGGWIKLHRKLLDSSIFTSDSGLRIWIWCLLRANHDECDVFVGIHKVHLMPGQFVFGRESASESLGISPSTVRNWINILQQDSRIDIKPTNKYSVISVLNWNDYQSMDNKKDNRITTEKQQNNTDKKDKNVKKIISKDITEAETSEVLLTNKSYGNTDINTLLDTISKLTPTGKLDGSEKDNRRLAYTIIRKHTLETALKALRNVKGSFYEGKINSARNLYNNFNALLNAKADTRTTDIFDLISNSYDKL